LALRFVGRVQASRSSVAADLPTHPINQQLEFGVFEMNWK
jgi:hypothetical protein